MRPSETLDWIEARPLDPEPLVVRGGVFTNIANRIANPKHQEVGYKYWGRNIRINRSNTEIDGVILRVTGETDVGQPYDGFLKAEQCANVTLRNCSIDGRAPGKPSLAGSYGYNAFLVVNFRMINFTMENIHDRSRWGVIATNFMKNILIEDCVLSRMDVHQGVSGDYIIRRTTLGYQGLIAIGRGRLIVEDLAR